MFDHGAAIAAMNLDGMYWDTEGGGIGKAPAGIVTSCVLNASTTIHPASGTFGHILGGAGVSGTGIPGGTTVTSGSNGGTSITLSAAATATTTTNLTFTNPGGSDFVTWSWENFNNGFGGSSSQSQQNGWAQTAGADTMAAINAGFQAQGGNSVIVGNQVPITTYQSVVAGFPLQVGGYWDVMTGRIHEQHIDPYRHCQFDVDIVPHRRGQPDNRSCATGRLLFLLAGQSVTSGGPYSSDHDGGWARAL